MTIRFHERALNELMVLIQNQPKKALKVLRLLELLRRDPKHSQLGKVEKLRHLEGYSIRVDHEHRLIFSLEKHWINVYSLLGHYED